jgi:hypothetical protein
MDKVNTFSEEMLLHYSSPNKDLVVEILQLDANSFQQVNDYQLSRYILVLGQYLVMIQHNENLKNIEYMLAAKAFEHKMNTERFAREDIKGSTLTERKAWLVANSESLAALEQEVLVAEAEKMVIHGMVKAVEGLLNALKKEKSTGRYPE